MGCRSKPTWENMIGIRIVDPVGNGVGLRLIWGRAIPADDDNQVHYNIYYASNRIGVFSSGPKAITTDQSVVLNAFSPGDLQYLAVRATEFDPTEFDITRLTQIGVGVYSYPAEQTLQEVISDAYGTSVVVEDGGDFPDIGFIQVGTEVMKYTNKDANEFYIEDIYRGQFSTEISTHDVGETVSMWRGVEDGNSSIMLRTASWHDNATPQSQEVLGELNVDADGYRAANEDLLTTDLTASDQNTEDFPSYDYTGYHNPSMQSTFTGECVRSYVGGEFDGGRGLFLQARNLARLDSMLQTTGEPVVLLRRIWKGQRCHCINLRREHPRTRCASCFGTGFAGGYDRYINTRPISELSRNTQGMINIRVTPYTDDLELNPDQGATQPSEISAWTLGVPAVKDRDFIVRFNEDGTEEFRYEILDVTRNKLFFGQSGRQQFKMRRHDKTDVIYQYDIAI